MRVSFRTDASLAIGTGHVMRCLTLADCLARSGAVCNFVCREHEGNFIESIRGRGHAVSTLAVTPSAGDTLSHASWLGAHWRDDMQRTSEVLAVIQPDWLVVDHYALDARWERGVLPRSCQLLVIDDIADRDHDCQLLLDQNLGRHARDYQARVPAACRALIGPTYALLRPEFAALRGSSLARRHTPTLRTILITMGGVDAGNATCLILEALDASALPPDCLVKVVMGKTAPWLAQVQERARTLRVPCEVLVNVSDMARHMVESDLAIGAAGSTSWERCCLGLPSLLVCLADNQREALHALGEAGAALPLELADAASALPRFFARPDLAAVLATMSQAASQVTDGRGAERVLDAMKEVSS